MIVSAPAKINLTLEVTGIEDNGYHTLDTVFVWLALEDSLSLEKAPSTSLSLKGEGVNVDSVEVDESNLVMRAHRAVEKRVDQDLPTRYRLLKRIPAGGGLGGGSADAAAALIGLNSLYDLGLRQEHLLELARPLGADVSFGLIGGAARGTRYGDLLEPVKLPNFLFERDLVLIFPEFGCPTPAVYGLWDKEPSHVARGRSQMLLSLHDHPEDIFDSIANDLEEPAFRLHPELRNFKEALRRAGLRAPCLSGSGSTLFGFLPQGGDVEEVEQALSTLGVRVVITKLKEEARVEFVS